MKITVKERQTVSDIALIYCGDVCAVMEIATANDVSITDDLSDGTTLEIATIVNKKVTEQYAAHGVAPATAVSDAERELCPYEGIGIMAVGIDLRVA